MRYAMTSPLKSYEKDGFSFLVARANCGRSTSLGDVFTTTDTVSTFVFICRMAKLLHKYSHFPLDQINF